MVKVLETSSGFIGAGGEHAVASELIFREFNASIMSVDTGIDVVAVKNGRTYNVQVKTSTLNKSGWYTFDIRMVSLERHSASDVYYIFVLRLDEKNQYVILPSTEIEKSISTGGIYTVKKYDKYRVAFKLSNEQLILGQKSNDITYYLNNWSIIK